MLNYKTIIDSKLKLVSLNARGINNFHKRRSMFTWCRKRKVDLYSFKRRTQGRNQKSKGETNVVGIFIIHMEAQIFVESWCWLGIDYIAQVIRLSQIPQGSVFHCSKGRNWCQSLYLDKHLRTKQRQNNVQIFQKFT